jgi:hypothetical protein
MYNEYQRNTNNTPNIEELGPHDVRNHTVNQVPIVLSFCDIFAKYKDELKTVILIPAYQDGILYQLLHRNCNNKENISRDCHSAQAHNQVVLSETKCEQFPSIMFFGYSNVDGSWNDKMKTVLNLVPDNHTLVIPSIGTNNSVTFVDSAKKIYDSVVYACKNKQNRSNLTINVTSLYNREHNSKRVIEHLNYLFRVNAGRNNSDSNQNIPALVNSSNQYVDANLGYNAPFGFTIPTPAQNYTDTPTVAPVPTFAPILPIAGTVVEKQEAESV